MRIWQSISDFLTMDRAGNTYIGATPENKEMLQQFYGNLDVAFLRIDTATFDPVQTVIHGEVAKILQAADPATTNPPVRNWKAAYKAEQLLAAIRPPDSVLNELRRTLAGLKEADPDLHAAYAPEFDRILAAPQQPDVPAARALLERALNDWQWKSNQRFLKRVRGLRYTGWILFFLLLVIAIYTVVVAATAIWQGWSWSYAGLTIALAAGLLGASFSLLTSRNATLAEASLEATIANTATAMILVRIGVGGTGALLLYFFFESGLIGGEAFPDLGRLGFVPVSAPEGDGETFSAMGFNVPNDELCKLMVWSFVAGFSEKLVPAMLGRVENPETPK